MYDLHAVIIDKSVPKLKAQKMAQEFIKDKDKTFIRETSDSYRFRNIPKTKFHRDSFRSKVVNSNITLVYGKLI